MSRSSALTVIVTTGLEDGGRKAAIAIGVALAALVDGTRVHLFLSLESAPFATPTGAGEIRPRGFSDPLGAYIRHFVELGGQLEVCSSCFEEYCRSHPKDEHGHTILLPGTTIESLAVIARRANEMPILTF
jgi:predicted peroxiredoxin